MYIVLVVITAVITSVVSITLPSYFPKCFIDDPDISNCIVNAARKLGPYLEEGITELHMGPLKPLTLGNVNVSHKSINANFRANANKIAVYGMQHFDLIDVEFLPKEVTLKGVIRFGDVHVFSGYVLDGHILNIPVTGNGFMRGLLSPANISFVLKGDLVKIQGVAYCKLRNVKISYKISTAVMEFEGLEVTSGSWGITNEEFKRRSKEVATVLSPVYEKIIKAYLVKYLKWFLREIPYFDLFPEQ